MINSILNPDILLLCICFVYLDVEEKIEAVHKAHFSNDSNNIVHTIPTNI